MNRRLLRLILALYPRDWRQRYGTEVADLAQDLVADGERTPWRSALDLLAGAAKTRARAVTAAPTATIAGAVIAVSAAGLVLVGYRHGNRGGSEKPYFDTSPAGWLLLVVVFAWLMIEFVQFLRVQEHPRTGVTRSPATALRPLSIVALVIANAWLYTAPLIAHAATISPGAVAFGIGLALLIAGLTLRVWSFHALGGYFTYSVQVSPDQHVVESGPYRLIRHPSYAGGLLAYLGIGLMSANWVGVAAMVLLPLVFTVWRIRIEETALLTTITDRYQVYAADHKRLIPAVW
jgi:protein-S-isoprenylcysteine O-methyltransferase Ste14